MKNNDEWAFPVGQPILVEHNDLAGRVISYKAYLGLYDGNSLQLGFDFNELPIINPGVDLILKISQEVEHYYQVKVIDVFLGQGLITVSKPHRTDIRVMRQFFRCEVSFHISLDTGTKTLTGLVRNISAGGILVEVENPGRLICGMRLSCSFLIPGSTAHMAVRGDIVRVDKDIDGLTPIAIRFTVIHEKNRKEILQYQYRCQREALQKQRSEGSEK